MQRKKKKKKTEHSIQELWENFKKYNIHIIRILEVETGVEEIIEVILAENFPKLMTDTKPHTKSSENTKQDKVQNYIHIDFI